MSIVYINSGDSQNLAFQNPFATNTIFAKFI